MEDIKLCIMSHIKKYFKKDEVVLVMTSIDSTSVSSVLQDVFKQIVGGNDPHHYILIPDFSDEKENNKENQADFVKKSNKEIQQQRYR